MSRYSPLERVWLIWRWNYWCKYNSEFSSKKDENIESGWVLHKDVQQSGEELKNKASKTIPMKNTTWLVHTLRPGWLVPCGDDAMAATDVATGEWWLWCCWRCKGEDVWGMPPTIPPTPATSEKLWCGWPREWSGLWMMGEVARPLKYRFVAPLQPGLVTKVWWYMNSSNTVIKQ